MRLATLLLLSCVLAVTVMAKTKKAADGTGNLSKARREELSRKVAEIQKFLSLSEDPNAVRLRQFAAELAQEVRTKKYGLVFERHKERVDVELEENLPVLTEDKKRFVDNGGELNFLIEGDNLAALKLLEKTHRGKVDLIYIDPPYNTGNKDFVYNDSFVDANDTFRHSKWLSFMEPRLKTMRTLLARDGFICISIDDKELCSLRMLCDAIFIPENFVACLPRRTKSSGKTTRDVSANHDYVVIYARNKECAAIGGLPHIDNGFKHEDEFVATRGKFKLNQTLDYDSLQYSPSLDYPLEIGGETFYPGQSKEEWEKRQSGDHKRADWEWRWSRELFDFGLKNGFVVVKRKKDGSSRIYTKTYLNAQITQDEMGQYKVEITKRVKPLSTLDFLDKEYSNDNAKKELKELLEDCPFDYPKPTSLISKLVAICMKTNAVVLDCFAGSGTTGHAVMKLNAADGGRRRFILVTNNENGICENVTYERLKRVIKKENYAARLKYLKVGMLPVAEKLYYEYANDLLAHVRELVELAHAVDFRRDTSVAIVQTDAELAAFVADEARLAACRTLYIGHDALVGGAAAKALAKRGIERREIPQEFYPEQED